MKLHMSDIFHNLYKCIFYPKKYWTLEILIVGLSESNKQIFVTFAHRIDFGIKIPFKQYQDTNFD